jgi:hypothetical protein
LLLVDDPSAPTTFPPGSAGKLCVLEARRALGLPLFLPDDAEGARRLEVAEPGSVAQRSQIERRICQVISDREMPAKKLAHLIGCVPGQHVYKALYLLAQAGVVEHTVKGWKLCAV